MSKPSGLTKDAEVAALIKLLDAESDDQVKFIIAEPLFIKLIEPCPQQWLDDIQDLW